MPAPYTGGCQCGQVRCELTGEPIRLIAFHGTECQRQSGNSFVMSMIVRQNDLKISGLTKSFVQVADSGNENMAVFCPNYGVRIHNTPH